MDAENVKKTEAIVDFDFGNDSVAVDLSGTVHQLPCTIKLDGISSVSQYFKPKSTGNALIFPISPLPSLRVWVIRL